MFRIVNEFLISRFRTVHSFRVRSTSKKSKFLPTLKLFLLIMQFSRESFGSRHMCVQHAALVYTTLTLLLLVYTKVLWM
jgi:hypothetical protein